MPSSLRWSFAFLITTSLFTTTRAQSIWTNIIFLSQNNVFERCIYDKGLFVTVGRGDGAGVWSKQGDSPWVERYRNSMGQFHDIVLTDQGFLAFGEDHSVPRNGITLSSTNGLDWVQGSSPNTPIILAIARFNGTLIAVIAGGLVARSQDGVIWTGDIIRDRFEPHGIACSGNRIVVCGKSNKLFDPNLSPLMSSADGVTWEASAVSGFDGENVTSFNKVRWLNNRFVAVGISGGNDVSAVSDDGIHWQISDSPPHKFGTVAYIVGWYDVTFGNGTYVTVGGGIFVSADALHWKTVITGTSAFSSVCAGPDSFAAVGYQLVTSPFDLYFRSSAPDHGVFSSQVFGMGNGAAIEFSNDATNWLHFTNLTGSEAVFSTPIESTRFFRATRQ